MLKTYPSGEYNDHRRFIKTGEFRPPLRGEWYLSGAVPHAYQAPNDLAISYVIMRVTHVPVRAAR